MAINKELFAEVKKHILAEPRRYNQWSFGGHVSKKESPCGTQACILGWAALLDKRVPMDANLDDDPYYHRLEIEGRMALGLSPHEAEVVAYTGWPEPYGSRYHNARSKRERAQAAADYIDSIIATGKVTE